MLRGRRLVVQVSWNRGLRCLSHSSYKIEQGLGSRNDRDRVTISVDVGSPKLVREGGGGWIGRMVPKVHTVEGARHFVEKQVAHFLPEGYPHSVPPQYLKYVQWSQAGALSSAIAGVPAPLPSVLSMQSLLYAIGLGQGSIPVAGALSWIIKDGIGQLGGIIFASNISSKFDADPKSWRMVSAVSLDVAIFLEVLSPLFPSYFILIAGAANIGKNISWLSASATRAAIHRSFALRDNLGDITAKSGSQSVAVSLLGTTIGVAVSPLLGSNIPNLIGAFFVFSSIHLACNYISLNQVVVDTLNAQRTYRLMSHYIDTNQQTILTPVSVSQEEEFLNVVKRNVVASGVAVDRLFPHAAQLIHVKEMMGEERYLLNVLSDGGAGGSSAIGVAMESEASDSDVLQAYLHAAKLHRLLLHKRGAPSLAADPATFDACFKESLSYARTHVSHFASGVVSKGWRTDHVFLEERNLRYKWVEG